MKDLGLELDLRGAVDIKYCGKHLYISSKKGRALIAMLALSPNYRRTRSWLKYQLWFDQNEQQSSRNLRQVLSLLRKQLGLGASILNTSNEQISLDKDKFSIIFPKAEEQLLAGLDIRDEAFEDWLREERAFHETHGSSTFEVDSEIYDLNPTFKVGLLPTFAADRSIKALELGNYLLERTAEGFTQNGIVSVVDYRHTFAGLSNDSNNTLTQPADLFIQNTVTQFENDLSICCRFFDADQNSLLWSGTVVIKKHHSFIENIDLKIFTNQILDFTDCLVGSTSFKSNEQNRAASSLALAAICEILKAREGNLMQADENLIKAFEIEPNSIYQAWRTQIYAYLIGERLVENDLDYRAKLKEIVVNTTSIGRFNPVSLSLAAHAHSFIFRDYQSAQDIFSMVLKQNPSQAICYDMAATTNVYTGNKKAAYEQSQLALKLGQLSPFRYCIETTCAMASALNKKYDESSFYSDQVRKKKPTYTAFLRWDIPAKSYAGDFKAAEKSFDSLIKLEPDFSIGLLSKHNYPGALGETSDFLVSGFKLLKQNTKLKE